MTKKSTKKKLVVYYSFEGNTRFIAKEIAKELNADLLELKPIKDLKSHGVSKYLWGGRQVVMKTTPELQTFNKNPEDYDVILIGTPVWAFTYTPAIRSFFSQVKLQNKKIAVFCTHEGGMKDTLENMKTELSGNTILGVADFQDVLKTEENKQSCKEQAKTWAKNLKEKM